MRSGRPAQTRHAKTCLKPDNPTKKQSQPQLTKIRTMGNLGDISFVQYLLGGDQLRNRETVTGKERG